VFLDDDKNVTLGEGRSASSAWYNAAYRIEVAKDDPGMVEFCGGKPTGLYDMVNSPPHYRQGSIETIDAIKAALTPEEFRGYCKGNAMKYVWRERNKGGDQEKAALYLNRINQEKS
jgi:hypothetical protein